MEENLDFSHMCDNLLVIRKSNYVRSSACDTQLAVHSTTVVWYPLMLVSYLRKTSISNLLSAHTLRWRDPNGRWDACRGASGGAPQLVCAIVMARMRGGTRSG